MTTPRLLPLAVLLAALATIAAPGRASAPQIVDPRGDANGLDTRHLGVPGPRDLPTEPASQPSFDITSVHWYADPHAVFAALALAAPPDPDDTGRYVLTFATPTCATAAITWVSNWTGAVLQGCRPKHLISLAAPRWTGGALQFRIPRGSLTRWLPAGTPLRELGARAHRWVDLSVGAAYPLLDGAGGSAGYRLGD